MIRFIKPDLPPPEAWLPYLQRAYDHAWFSNFGPVHESFADALTAKYGSGDRIAVPVASATTGLAAVLMALGIRGRVVIPSFTFVATGQAVLEAGCTPVFCEVDPVTWELSASALERLLDQTRVDAVMPVRAYGLARDLSTIETLCARHGVSMIVDSAAALGGRLPDATWIGTQGVAEIFSLHATKTFGIGEGGVIFCAPALAERIRRVINFGLEDGDIRYQGINGKLDEFKAAVGLAVLQRIDEVVVRRTRYIEYYRAGLAEEVRAGLLALPENTGFCAFQTLPVRLASRLSAAALVEGAASDGVELRRYYNPPLHRSTLFAPYASGVSLPHTEALSESMICLPVHSRMEAKTIERVLAALRKNLCPVLNSSKSACGN
ncbi:DegT/DnrJ/EryC1/StrS family aminotransferase [Thermithiobacillus plumbiphilus]|uniref:DegT/DnrJ/EryC1/StrS family aminotransferase n=1 Tax=Thermithiobacillus plumbiphilus TaxID=1729899 RepID=A0ABU9DAM6_9PROT